MSPSLPAVFMNEVVGLVHPCTNTGIDRFVLEGPTSVWKELVLAWTVRARRLEQTMDIDTLYSGVQTKVPLGDSESREGQLWTHCPAVSSGGLS